MPDSQQPKQFPFTMPDSQQPKQFPFTMAEFLTWLDSMEEGYRVTNAARLAVHLGNAVTCIPHSNHTKGNAPFYGAEDDG